MFKPFDYFLMEKTQGLKGGSKDKNTKILDEYEKADDKDLLRHIKVAECAFDGHTKVTFIYFHLQGIFILIES